MSFDHVAHLSQPLQAGLWHDGLEYGSNELLERAPGLSLGLTRGRLAWSGGGGPAGRVLKRVNHRLEQQDHQEMRQHPGSCRSVVDAGRLFQTDQTLEPFEPQFYPPSQSIERQHIVGEECVVTQRGDYDEPAGGIQRFPRRGVAGLAPLLTDLPSCGPRLRRGRLSAAASGLRMATKRRARGGPFLRRIRIGRSIRSLA